MSSPAPTEGARALAAVCGEIATGRCLDLEPTTWAGHVRYATYCAGGAKQLQESLFRRLVRYWRIEPTQKDQAAALNEFIRREVHLMNMTGDVVPRAAVLTAMRALSLLLPRRHNSVKRPFEELKLERMLVDRGVPLGLLRTLQGHESQLDVERNSGIPSQRMRHWLGVVRTNLRVDMPFLCGRVVPKFAKGEVEERRAYYRQLVRAVIAEQGAQNRTALRKLLWDQLDWLLEHDTEWFDRVVPSLRPAPKKSASMQERRDVYRRKVEAVIARGIHSWSKVQRESSHAFEWLRKHDLAWLESHVQRRKMRYNASSGEKRIAYRAMLMTLKRAGVAQRSAPAVHRTAVEWIRENDQAWLDRHFPALTRR